MMRNKGRAEFAGLAGVTTAVAEFGRPAEVLKTFMSKGCIKISHYKF